LSEHDREGELFEERHGAERWLLPYYEDSALWPVLMVVLAHVAAFGAAAILFAVRDGRPVALLGTFFLVVGSVMSIRWERRERGGFRAFGWTVVATWLASLALAWAGWRYDFL
jgi:hypothetical protein